MKKHDFYICTTRTPQALPRILLTLARRRLSVERLAVEPLDEQLAEVHLQCYCDAFIATQLVAQMRHIVEVRQADVVEG